MRADVLGQEPQHDVTVLLQQEVLPPVAAIGFGVSQMLGAVEFNRYARICVHEINFRSALSVERNRQFDVQPEPAGGLRQSLQPAVQERLGRAPRAFGAVGVGRKGTGACRDRKN